MNNMFKNIGEILFMWVLNLLAVLGVSQDVNGQLTIIEQALKIAVLLATLVFTCYKIKKIRGKKPDDEFKN